MVLRVDLYVVTKVSVRVAHLLPQQTLKRYSCRLDGAFQLTRLTELLGSYARIASFGWVSAKMHAAVVNTREGHEGHYVRLRR